MVEWPVALRATFEERYLAVPQEALITTMQDNQKYFCLINAEGKLQPYFITISNIESKDPIQIIEGNEKLYALVCRMQNSSSYKTKSNRLHLVKKNSRIWYSKHNWVRFGTNQNVLLN